MPAPAVITPTQERVRQIAHQALEANEEVHVWFRVSPERDLRGCEAALRGMQAAFSSMRAKARRKSIQASGESYFARDPNVKGPYDNIACIKHVLPNGAGYKLVFMPGYMALADLEITNAKGEPLETEDPRAHRFATLFIKVLTLAERAHKNHGEGWYWPLNEEETRFVREYDQAFFEDRILHQYLPWKREEQRSAVRETAFGTVVDLAELEGEELEFDNGEGMEEN